MPLSIFFTNVSYNFCKTNYRFLCVIILCCHFHSEIFFDEELVCKHKSAIILTPIIKFCTISTKASKQTSTISWPDVGSTFLVFRGNVANAVPTVNKCGVAISTVYSEARKTRHWSDVGSMLGHRLWRWSKIVPTLVQILIFCDVMSLSATNMRHLYLYVGYLTDCFPSRSGELGLVNSAWWTIIRKIMCD